MTSPINNDYYKLASYAAGAQLNHNPFGVEGLQSQLIFAGATTALPLAWQTGKAALWTAPKWAWQNFGNYATAWNALQEKNKAAKDAIKYLKGDNIFQTINNRSNYNSLLELEKKTAARPTYAEMSATTKPSARAKLFNKSVKATYYDEARKLIEEAKAKKLTGKELREHLKKVDEAIAKADLEVHKAVKSGLIKPATKMGKAWAGVKKYTGYDAVNGALKKGAASSNKAVRTIAKGAKGGGIATAAIGLAIETPEIIETYKKCGAGKGTKQLAKTTAVAAAEGVGYAVGAKVGAIAGAKLGATIGTCIGGPVGTAIGGAVGALVGVGTGILCSWLAGKGVKSLMGKSELQKHNEAEAKKLAKNAKNSKEGKEKLLSEVEKKAAESGGCTDEEVIAAYEKLTTAKESSISHSDNNKTYSATNTSNYSDILNALAMLAEGNISYTQTNMMYQPFMPSMSNIFGMNMFNMYYPYYPQSLGIVA